MYGAREKKSCKTKLYRTVVEEYISRTESTSPGRDAVFSSFPTWSAAYLKQTRTSNRFLIYLTMLCPPPAYPEIQRNFSAFSRQSKSKPVSQPISKGQGEDGREKAIQPFIVTHL